MQDTAAVDGGAVSVVVSRGIPRDLKGRKDKGRRRNESVGVYVDSICEVCSREENKSIENSPKNVIEEVLKALEETDRDAQKI